jgi:hypothetical protein
MCSWLTGVWRAAGAETEELFEMEMEKSATQPACGGRAKEKHEPAPAVPATGPSFGAGYDLQYA